MLVQFNTDNSVQGNEALAHMAEAIVTSALGHFTEHITRVEVHLSDENSDKKVGTDAKRCLLEARLASRQPIAVSHQAATLEQAIEGAAQKMARAVETVLGRLGYR
jgi:ribosome-associated translation inhibitor RaiA